MVKGVTETYQYDPFGNLVGKTVNGQPRPIPVDASSNRLQGEAYDPAGNVTTQSGQPRYHYDSFSMVETTTPWTTCTPGITTRIWGGSYRFDPVLDMRKTPGSPQLWNRYSYVTNNPIRFTDPDGRECGGCAAFERDVRELQAGKITVEEYNSRLSSRGAGALAGLAVFGAVYAAAHTGPALAAEAGTIGSRRLYAFQQAGIKTIRTVQATAEELAKELPRKFATATDGISVRVR